MSECQGQSVFAYGHREMTGLHARDPLLLAVIDRFGSLQRTMWPDPFTALARSLVAQQISNAAATAELDR